MLQRLPSAWYSLFNCLGQIKNLDILKNCHTLVILCLILGLSLHLADVVILGSGLGFGDRFAEVLVFCPHPCLDNIFAHILLDGVTLGVIPETMSMLIMVITGMYSLFITKSLLVTHSVLVLVSVTVLQTGSVTVSQTCSGSCLHSWV